MADKAVVAPESAAPTPEKHSVEAAALAIAKLDPSAVTAEDKKKPAKATPAAKPAPKVEEPAEPQVESEEEMEPETPSPEDEDEGSAAAEPDEDEEPAPPPRKVKVKVKDGDKDVEEEVDEQELIKGYQRQKDYTRKTQSLAEERKKAAADHEAVKAERAAYAERLTQLQEAIKAATPPEPDWAKARAELTTEDFIALKADWDLHKERVAKINADAEKARAKVEEDQLAALSEHIEQEKAKLLKAIPSWEKPEVAKAEKKEMTDYALEEYGFTPENMAQVTDHRILLILRKAMLYDKRVKADAARLKAGREKLAAAATVTPPPGTPKAPGAKKAKAVAESRNRLRESGGLNDAAAAIKNLGLAN